MTVIKKRMPKDPNKLAARIVELATNKKKPARPKAKRQTAH